MLHQVQTWCAMCTDQCVTVDYQQIENGNIANQIQGFTIDYGKFILMGDIGWLHNSTKEGHKNISAHSILSDQASISHQGLFPFFTFSIQPGGISPEILGNFRWSIEHHFPEFL